MPLDDAEALIYTEVVSIYRETNALAAGARPTYAGVARASTLPPAVHMGVPCSIQAQRGGGSNPPKLPADTKRSDWFILIPESVAPAKGSIKQGDLVVDENGDRYTVQADYWSSMGWRLGATKEEA